ncbi:MAG TPA: methyltransferase domain-containing protein [Candidatus Acidoferrales bacterium]|nr:methyltransferase domain-containing protein [Candidatus Acidoferrales bacterium]
MQKLTIEKKLYKNRFGKEFKKRNALWSILCKQFFQQFIFTNDIVLDVATGYGEFINNITCKKKFALDINPDSKKYMQSTVTFLLCPSTKIKLKEKSVDKIFLSNFFEHITREEILQTITEFHRILKPSGKILILQPNIRFCSKDYWMFFDHITPIDDRALEEAFSYAGFKTDLRIERFLPFTTKSAMPQHPFFVHLYLSLKPAWRIFGKQSFLIFEKT